LTRRLVMSLMCQVWTVRSFIVRLKDRHQVK